MFDQLAGSWDSDRATGRDDPLHDALARSGSFPRGICLEIGSGTSLFTPTLAVASGTVISIDPYEQMFRQAAGRSLIRVRADASALPSADASVSVVAAIDMLLFPHELARWLACWSPTAYSCGSISLGRTASPSAAKRRPARNPITRR
ncbi:class I SAM-dependent methyltransferase [Streptomyces sp. NPDC057636]|uniref:class I SAM-dependent methyltransferase n=1 Tax=Streptomyces sp. NPDC057636 TaxID=3346189 RepID=UPI00368465C8